MVVLCCFLEIKLLDPVVHCFLYYMFMCVYKYSYNYYMFILHVHRTIHVYHVIFRLFLHVNGGTKSLSARGVGLHLETRCLIHARGPLGDL